MGKPVEFSSPPAPDEAQTSQGEATSRATWLILLLLAFGVLIAYVDRTSISSAMAEPPFVKHFGLSDVDRGWVGAAFFWSYGLMQLPMGWIVDRYGVKTPYTLCFVIWCIATVLTGAISTLAALVVMRVIVGAAEAAVIPASYRWIRNNFSEGKSGTAVGIFTAANKFGPAIGAPMAAWLIVAYDWRVMFFVTGAAGLVWLLPWHFGIKNDFPSKAQRALNRATPAEYTLGCVLRSPMVWGTIIVAFCYGYFTFYCMTWMPSYLVEQHGVSLAKSGLYTFFSFAGIALVALAAGWAADQIIARGYNPVVVRKSFIVAGFVGACTVLFGAFAQSLQAALFWNVFSLSFLGLATANNLALCRLTLIPKPAVGLVTGVQQVATSLSGGVAASLSGWLLKVGGGYFLPMLAIVVFCAIGAITTLTMLRVEWAPKPVKP
jgi:ACS family D-galactonate transporter-like MFS transporter